MNVRLHVLAIVVLLCGLGAPSAAVAIPGPMTASAAEVRKAPQPAAFSALTAPVPALSDAASTAQPSALSDDKATDDAIDSNLGDHSRYRAVIDALQKAVGADDAAAVAALVRYPIGVRAGGRKVTLKNREMFVARYREFMTPDIKKAIVTAKYPDLFVNYKGVMFGTGQAWITGICKGKPCKTFDVKVITLQNGPD